MSPSVVKHRPATVEPVVRSRLLPRVSFQSLLVVTAIAAGVIAVVDAADQGGVYATAAAVGFAFLLVMVLAFAVVFLLAWAVSYLPRLVGGVALALAGGLIVVRVLGLPVGPGFLFEPVSLIGLLVVGAFLLLFPIGRTSSGQADSPFAADQLPPQILPPRDPTD